MNCFVTPRCSPVFSSKNTVVERVAKESALRNQKNSDVWNSKSTKIGMFSSNNTVIVFTHNSARLRRRIGTKAVPLAELQGFTEEMVMIERSLGTSKFMSVASWPPRGIQQGDELAQEAPGYMLADADRLAAQEVVDGGLDIRVYQGRVTEGFSANARVILKAYPSRSASSLTSDLLATNELVTYAALQPDDTVLSPFLCKLLGGFTATQGLTRGEQWLVFRDDGTVTAAEYAAQAAAASSQGIAVGQGEFWDQFDDFRPLGRRKSFIRVILFQVMRGLLFLHSNDRAHQSLGPNSVVLSTVEERDVRTLQVRLQDLAFAVDVSPQALQDLEDRRQRERLTRMQELASDLWQRADSAGATSSDERRLFALADDIYAAGLMVAYLAFVSMSDFGTVDGLSLLKLFEGTFRLDIEATRDFCAADLRWAKSVDFLDENGRAGWELLQMMLNPDWEKRPTCEEVIAHRFFSA